MAETPDPVQWALCSLQPHGTKSAMLESKLSTGTSRTKRLHQDKFAFSLFWMSLCVACSPAWWILYHVTASCKGPFIVKFSAYQDKNFIKSLIKKLPKGTNIGISDDFPKQVDEIRRKLYSVLKAAKREKKEAYFKVEKLFINGYRGPETALFPLYGCLMNS